MSKKKRSRRGPWPLGRGRTQGSSAEASKAFAELETLPTFALVVSIFSLVIGLILAFIGNGEASYICAAIFGVSFAAFLLGSWWKTTSIASKADWSDWGWL